VQLDLFFVPVQSDDRAAALLGALAGKSTLVAKAFERARLAQCAATAIEHRFRLCDAQTGALDPALQVLSKGKALLIGHTLAYSSTY
jgi:hypothetical protein